MERPTSVAPPLPPPPGGDQLIVLRGISWEQYDALDRARGNASMPRFAYLDGELEIVTHGRNHELGKTLFARFLETYALARGVPLNGFGNETFRKKAKKVGLEPDECYSVGHARKLPDFALEVVETSGGIDKLEAYRRLGFREVWFLIGSRLYLYRRAGRDWRQHARSRFLPAVDLQQVARLARSTRPDAQTEALQRYFRRLQRRRR